MNGGNSAADLASMNGMVNPSFYGGVMNGNGMLQQMPGMSFAGMDGGMAMGQGWNPGGAGYGVGGWGGQMAANMMPMNGMANGSSNGYGGYEDDGFGMDEPAPQHRAPAKVRGARAARR